MECGRYRGDGRYRQHQCQNFEGTCLQDPMTKTLEYEGNQADFDSEEPVEDELEAALGAPRDQRHDDFQLFATCSGSGARQHTMAQATTTFQNSCADVSAELQARANGQQGWKDPHNRGNYAVLAVQGNVLKLKRRTGNNKYTDVITFAMQANGDGCKVNSCSVSQGNSNNDAGTNMCNMANLFCNSSVKNGNGVACKSVTQELEYNVDYMECGRYRNDARYRQHQCQDFAQTCLRQPSALAEEKVAPQLVLKYLEN